MKNSVNGKTFDEIFDQFARQINPESMDKGLIYFATDDGNRWIFEFSGVSNAESYDLYMFNDSIGNCDGFENNNGSEGVSNGCQFYEATPDQIALLKSYKQ